MSGGAGGSVRCRQMCAEARFAFKRREFVRGTQSDLLENA